MHDFSPFYSPYGSLVFAFAPIIAVVALWSVLIKGYALWIAARAGQKGWFVALLLINTVGILEIVYLIWFSPPGSNKFNSHAHTPAGNSSPQA